MPRHLRLRVGLVLVVVAVSVWYLYPLRSSINLGLDLQGGIHLVLGVDAEKALENQIERTAADAKAALDRKAIATTRVARWRFPICRPSIDSPGAMARQCSRRAAS